MRVGRRSTESAFTIVEVLVGALIITMVFAGAVYFIGGSGKSQQRTLVRQKMAAAADNISQRVRADQEWLDKRPACKTSECDVSDLFKVESKAGDPQFTATVGIRPIDGEGDGVGVDDIDHVTPDFYRIGITIKLASAAEEETWGKQAPFETVSTVDATAIGKAVGSLIVQTCETTNQVDERMSIANCEGDSGATLRQMEKQPSPCKDPFPMSLEEWVTPGKRSVLPLGPKSSPTNCNKAYNEAKAKDTFMTGVNLRPTNNVGFTLKRVDPDTGAVTTRVPSNADNWPGITNGTYVFSGLPAGQYKIVPDPPKGREVWPTKMIPSWHAGADAATASVQANQEARALIMVRPIQGKGEYHVRFTRATWHYGLSTKKTTEFEDITGAGMTVRVTTTYTYLIPTGPVRKVWPGPAYTGILAMEPKPFDRYHEDGSTATTQPAALVAWDDKKAPNDGWITISGLPTGLATPPTQQPTPEPKPNDEWGSFGTRSMDCFPARTPGGSCGPNFVWFDHRPGEIGEANSTVSFHSEDGECYLHADVPPFDFGTILQNKLDRCSRDFLYVNPKTGKKTWIKNFLPDKEGNGGGQMLINMTQTSECIANCEYASGGGTVDLGFSDPSSNNVGAIDSDPPRGTTTKTPVVHNDPPPPPSGGGGGSGGSTGGALPATGTAMPSTGGGSSFP